MDIKLEKKPWYIRYRYYLAGAFLVCCGLIYVIVLASGPRRLRINAEHIQIEEVKQADFMEYVDVEGIVHPILTIIVNTREAGNVDQIIGEEGSLLKKGDTILTLTNPNLMREIEDQQDEWEKQRISYQEKALEMEQKSLTLKQQTLEAEYELNKIRKSFSLEKEEYAMGIRSKAQLEVSEDEYRYKTESTRLKLKSLQSDSSMTVIRKELLQNDRDREEKKLIRSRQRIEDLVVRSPIDGQLSFVKVTPGQQVAAGENIAEVKVMDQFKIHTSLSEYYIDRVTTGLPAAITYQGKRYPLKISKVIPEVKDRLFEVDLVFTGEMPEGFGSFNLPEGFNPSNPPDNASGNFPGQFSGSQTEATPSEASGTAGDNNTSRPAGGGRQMPGDDFRFHMDGTGNPASNQTGWIWIGASAAVLAIGLAVAKIYKH